MAMDIAFRASAATRRGSRHHLYPLAVTQDVKESFECAVEDCAETAAVLVNWADIPSWQKEGNLYIETGYRSAHETIWECFESWGYLHNESVNIYSHVFGAILFAFLPIYLFLSPASTRHSVATGTDIIVCSIYFLGVATCFFLSAVFHTTMIHSPSTYQAGIQLDFLGIVLLMWSATVPLVYYGFQCEPELQTLYWTLLSVLGATCAALVLQPGFRNPYIRPVRAVTFGLFGASNLLPILHSVLKHGWALQQQRMGLYWMLGTAFFDLVGAAAYSTKWPEKCYRRTFDLFGASHQILHICVVLAAITHAVGMISAFDFHHANFDTCLVY